MDDERPRNSTCCCAGMCAALYRYAYRWTGDVDQAEDLVQETLTRLYPELPRAAGDRTAAAVGGARYVPDFRRLACVARVAHRCRSSAAAARPARFSTTKTRTIEAADETWDPAVLAEQAFDRERIAGRVAPAA